MMSHPLYVPFQKRIYARRWHRALASAVVPFAYSAGAVVVALFLSWVH